jgi:hypothetical protein
MLRELRDISIIPLPNISGVANWRFSSQAMLTRDYPVGGAIGFYPNPKSQGSVFWFTSRLRKIDKSKQVDRLSAKFEATALSPVLDSLTLVRELAPGKRLLLAEDNFINQKVMLYVWGETSFLFLAASWFSSDAISDSP